jgi:ubiquinone/menaquinone biosynthesis C-methylase UbiE
MPEQRDITEELRTRKHMIKQCGRPTGELGLEVAAKMNRDHATLWAWGLDQLAKLEEIDGPVLDIGCGSGKVVELLANRTTSKRLVGLDHSGDMVELSRKTCAEACDSGRAEFITGSVSKLPFDDDTFELITAFETIYFWPEIQNDLVEVRRVLKPGGQFLAVCEAYDDPQFAERNAYCMEVSGGQTFAPNELMQLAIEAGFDDVQTRTVPEKNWLLLLAS